MTHSHETEEDIILQRLLSRIGEDTNTLRVNPTNVLPILANTVSLTEKYLTAPGPEKKQVVRNVMTKLFENVEVNDKEVVTQFLTNQANNVIDLIVAVANGQFKMNYDFQHFFSKLNCCKK